MGQRLVTECDSMTMTNSSLASLMAAVALAAAAVTPAAAAPTTIDFWYGNSGDISNRIQELCKQFNDSQSNYAVTCTSQGTYDASLQNTIAAYRAGKQPTVVQVSDVGTLDIMLSGAFQPVTKLMADNGIKVDWSDYFAGIGRYYATSKGEFYSMPFNSSTAMLYWNKDAFAKAGIDHAPATIEELAGDLELLKKSGSTCPYGTDISRDEMWQYLEQFSAIHNIPVASKNDGYGGLNAELVFNKGKFVTFIKDMKGWYDKGLLVLKTKVSGSPVVPAFASGECAIIETSIGDHGTITRTAAPGLNWGVAMLPVYAGTERKNSLVGGASLWVMAGKSADEYKAAANFLNFLRQPEQALFWSTVTGYIPVTKSGYDYMVSKGFYANAPYKGRELAIASLTASVPTENSSGMRLGGMLRIREEVANAVQEIFTKNADVQTALDDAAGRGNQVLRRFEETYQGKQLP